MIKRIFPLVIGTFLVSGLVAQGSLGLRLGNPIGVTYKQYMGNHAIEFVLGTADQNWNDRYYRKSFDRYDRYDRFVYRDHEVKTTAAAHGRYYLQYEVPVQGMRGEMQWFWGVGAFLRFSRVNYVYYNAPVDGLPGSDFRSNVDIGPELVTGLEYKFERIPLVVFGDASAGLELIDKTTLLIFSGVGVRYIF